LSDDYTDPDLIDLRWLNGVISETLRRYGPISSALPRVCPPDGAVIRAISVPGGTLVSTQAYSIHRDPELFPNRTSKFLLALAAPESSNVSFHRYVPSRCVNDEVSAKAKQAYRLLGAGFRACVGMHLAYMELRLATAELFRVFKGARLEPSTTPQSMEMKHFFAGEPIGHKCEIVLV
jgi:cytochrome P450